MCLVPCPGLCPLDGPRKHGWPVSTIDGMSTTTADVYAIPQELVDFRDMIRQIAQEKIAPRAAEIDRTASTRTTSASCSPSTTSSACRSRRSTAAPGPGR